jgi:dTDP-4-amino-4,6-dideoxygalactose transaminase
VVLRAKIKHIAEYNQQRRRVAHKYSELLAGIVTPAFEDNIGTHVYHQYTVLTDKRDSIMKKLSDEKIGCAIYYPIPLHQQKAFADSCKDVSLPVTEDIVKHCMSLPIYPELENDKIEHIVDVIKSAI